MITVSGEKAQFCDGMSRRNLLHAGFLGGIGLSLSSILQLQAKTASKSNKAVIFVELAGGPTQFETYDPKPSAPIEIRGAYEPISTSVSGTFFSEWMPQQAKIADKLSIIRSVWHPSNSHDPSSHLTQTGYYKSGPKGGPNQFPAFGSVISRTIGPNHPALPSYVAVPSVMRNGRAAYLGQSHNPFEAAGDPNKAGFAVPNLQLAKNISVDRLSSRRDLLNDLDKQRHVKDLQGATDALDEFSQQAFDLVHGSRAREAFHIDAEPDAIREQYGRNTVGQSMLLARRLVEAGVTCVTVRSTGWDDHNNIAKGLASHAVPYDQGVAALISDLHARGMQDDVLVIAMGEFGRTPRVNGNAGRDHWGAVMSVMLSGGGLKPGIVGSSNRKGEVPADTPYRPESILAMMYRHLGIDTSMTFNDPTGRPRYLLEERELIQEIL